MNDSILLPYQRRWFYDRSSLKVGVKARRVGLTWTTALEAVMHAGPVHLIALDQDAAKAFLVDCGWWCRRLGFVQPEINVYIDIQPGKLRGLDGLFIIDNAAFRDDLPALLKALAGPMVAGSRVIVLSTHNGDSDFRRLALGMSDGLHKITLDDAISEGLYRRVCEMRGTEWAPEGEAEWRRQLVTAMGDSFAEEAMCIPSEAKE